MTQIITRYFASCQARKARMNGEIVDFHRIIDVFDGADGLSAKLTAQSVAKDTADAYQARMAQGGAVMLVRAGYKPLGVAKTTRQITARFGAADLAPLDEEVLIKDPPKLGHQHTRRSPAYPESHPESGQTDHRMADWPIPLISRRKPYSESMFPRHARMAAFPIPLTDRRKPFTGSIFAPHARMANFPLPLISRRKPFTGSIIAPHARMGFPLPLISRHRYSQSVIIPRHGRMAVVPSLC